MNQRLYRSRDERIIFGVAGGLGEYFHVDPSLVRILWVVVAFATVGAGVLLYLVIALIVPEEPAGTMHGADWGRARSGYRWPDEAASPPNEPPPAASTSSADSTGGDVTAASPAAAAPFVSSTMSSATAPVAPTPASAPMGTESIPVSRAAPPPAATATAAMNAQPARATAADARAAAREQRREARAERRAARRDGSGALFWGLILVLVGGYFVVRTYFPAVDLDRLWPIVVIILGIVLVLAAFRRSPGPTR